MRAKSSLLQAASHLSPYKSKHERCTHRQDLRQALLFFNFLKSNLMLSLADNTQRPTAYELPYAFEHRQPLRIMLHPLLNLQIFL